MKKAIIVAVLIFAASALIQSYYALVSYIKGENIAVYPRFQKKNIAGTVEFNYWGLLSPIAVESQKVVGDTTKFTEKVMYPKAPKFKVVSPENIQAESFVAKRIATVIFDSISKIKIRRKFDYDNQAVATRLAANPSTVKLHEPLIQLSLFGTASPEAEKYGFEQSLLPNHFETENGELAKQRLDRTGALLQSDLAKLKITSINLLQKNSAELQFETVNQAHDAMRNRSLLNGMRYVKADVVITSQKLVVTPITTPVGLPLWLAGLIGLIAVAGLVKVKPMEPSVIIEKKEKFSWKWLWNVLLGVIGLAAMVLIGVLLNYIPYEYIAWFIIGLALLFAIVVLGMIIYSILKLTKADWLFIWEAFIDFLTALVDFLKSVFWLIIYCIACLIVIFITWIEKLKKWWSLRCTCCKILIIVLLLHYIVFIILHFGFGHIHY